MSHSASRIVWVTRYCYFPRHCAFIIPSYARLTSAAPACSFFHFFVIIHPADAFFRKTIKMLELGFEGQFHYACYYCFSKLKEQECKNIAWVATCLEHGAYNEVERIIPVFTRVVQKAAGHR